MLSLELDGRLPPEPAERLARHRSRCAACARAAEAQATTWRRLGALGPGPSAPDDFGVILARVDRRAGGWRAFVQALPASRFVAASLAASVLVGSTAGVALGSAAFGRSATAAPPEVTLLAEGFGDLPFGSPATGLARALSGREVRE